MFSLTTFVLIASKTQCQKNIYEQNFATWSTQNVFTSEEYQISRVNISFTAFSIIREHLFYQKQATLYVFFYVQNFLVIEWEKTFLLVKNCFHKQNFFILNAICFSFYEQKLRNLFSQTNSFFMSKRHCDVFFREQNYFFIVQIFLFSSPLA